MEDEMSKVHTSKLPSYQQDQLGFKKLYFFFQTSNKPQQNQLPFISLEPNHPTNAQLNTSLYSFFLLSKSLQTLSNPFLFLSFLFLPIGSSQAFLSQSPFLLTLFLAFFFLFFSAPFSSSQLPPLVLAKKNLIFLSLHQLIFLLKTSPIFCPDFKTPTY